MKLVKNILIVCFSILMIDGCIYRDPGVTLSNGYEIVAISPSSPCWLQYVSWNDNRTYSDYRAFRGEDLTTGESIFSLASETDVLSFSSELEWRAAIQEYRAAPLDRELQLRDVHSFAANNSHIIGTYAGGQFIVDIELNTLETFSDNSVWSDAVLRRTELSPTKLGNPGSRLLQSRHWFMVLLYVLLFITAVVSSFIPVEPNANSGNQDG